MEVNFKKVSSGLVLSSQVFNFFGVSKCEVCGIKLKELQKIVDRFSEYLNMRKKIRTIYYLISQGFLLEDFVLEKEFAVVEFSIDENDDGSKDVSGNTFGLFCKKLSSILSESFSKLDDFNFGKFEEMLEKIKKQCKEMENFEKLDKEKVQKFEETEIDIDVDSERFWEKFSDKSFYDSKRLLDKVYEVIEKNLDIKNEKERMETISKDLVGEIKEVSERRVEVFFPDDDPDNRKDFYEKFDNLVECPGNYPTHYVPFIKKSESINLNEIIEEEKVDRIKTDGKIVLSDEKGLQKKEETKTEGSIVDVLGKKGPVSEVLLDSFYKATNKVSELLDEINIGLRNLRLVGLLLNMLFKVKKDHLSLFDAIEKENVNFAHVINNFLVVVEATGKKYGVFYNAKHKTYSSDGIIDSMKHNKLGRILVKTYGEDSFEESMRKVLSIAENFCFVLRDYKLGCDTKDYKRFISYFYSLCTNIVDKIVREVDELEDYVKKYRFKNVDLIIKEYKEFIKNMKLKKSFSGCVKEYNEMVKSENKKIMDENIRKIVFTSDALLKEYTTDVHEDEDESLDATLGEIRDFDSYNLIKYNMLMSINNLYIAEYNKKGQMLDFISPLDTLYPSNKEFFSDLKCLEVNQCFRASSGEDLECQKAKGVFVDSKSALNVCKNLKKYLANDISKIENWPVISYVQQTLSDLKQNLLLLEFLEKKELIELKSSAEEKKCYDFLLNQNSFDET